MSRLLKPRIVEFGALTRTLSEYDDLMLWAGIYHLHLTSHPVRQFMREGLVPAA